jgi:repressor LexA
MQPVTEKQQSVYAFIHDFYRHQGRVPSIREIGKHFGIALRAVQQHLEALVKKGLIFPEPPKPSAYRIETAETGSRGREELSIPLLGKIAAGTPLTAYAVEGEALPLPPSLFGVRGQLFALTVVGDSMVGDGIQDGDVAIIQVTSETHPRDIVALRLDQEAFTLKRIRPLSRQRLELLPSNPDVSSNVVEAERVEVIGKYVGLIRRGCA